jgi:hypothetical protein
LSKSWLSLLLSLQPSSAPFFGFPYRAGCLRQSRVFGPRVPDGSKRETCTRPKCASVPSDSVLSVASITAGTTKLVCHIQKGAPKSVMTSPGLTRKRTAFWIVTAGVGERRRSDPTACGWASG